MHRQPTEKYTLDHDPERLEQAGEFARRIQLQLSRGNYVAARHLVNVAAAALDLPTRRLNQGSGIAYVGGAESRSLRIGNAIEKAHSVVTLGELLHVDAETLVSTWDMSTKSWIQLLQYVVARLPMAEEDD